MNRMTLRKELAKWLALGARASARDWSRQEMVDRLEEAKTKAMERRHFLKVAGAGMALFACSPNRSAEALLNSQLGRTSGENTRIVVLGAGFAGLTAAHYLRKAGLACEIYEARDRIGGRVLTKTGFNKDGMFIELGAEFVDTVHKDLLTMAGELGVEVQDYVEPISGLAEEVYFFGQKVVDPRSFLDQFKKFAGMVQVDTMPIRNGRELTLPSRGHPGPKETAWLDQISLAEYLQKKKSQGLSDDFVELIDIMYLGMLGLETGEQSVYNLLTLMDPWGEGIALYGDSDESKRIRGGNGRLVQALAQSVEKHTAIHLDHQLSRITDDGRGFTLDFGREGQETKRVRADLVLVTIPMPVLRTIQGFAELGLSPAKKAAIGKLGYATNAKLMMGFKERIWRQAGNKVPPNYGTVWSNGAFAELHDSSNHQPGMSGIILNYLGGKAGAILSPSLKEKTLRHLETMYPGIRTLADGNVLLQHWTSDPLALGSYICPRPGHFSEMGGFEQPVELGGRIVFAGDSLSGEFGGYMNGAIETGKKAAQLLAKALKPKIEVY